MWRKPVLSVYKETLNSLLIHNDILYNSASEPSMPLGLLEWLW